ncbi:MAG TPA: nucleotide sugar dehydrogenase [Nitrososphaerales archaeon]|nr:nucleotide sugar dehydrogenase [Nitrososphaerales archaeon]
MKQKQADTMVTKLKKGDLQVVVLGLGRIGLPTAGIFAKAGANVTGVDIKNEIVLQTNRGECRLLDEPELPEIIEKAVKDGDLHATTEPSRAIAGADVIIVCVPTPVDHTKSPDYQAVSKASRTIGKSLRKGTVVVLESTIGPGVAEDMVRPILEGESGLKAGTDFGLASCPERSDPGNIIVNMRSLPRIIGGIDQETTEEVAELYQAVLGVKAIRVSDPKTANAVKLTENLFRDVNIALANEFALLFEKLGIDAIEVINACASKYNFMPHYPGGGVGGPCLPSNSYYLISEGIRVGNIPYLIRLAREINDRMPDHVVELVGDALNDAGKTVRTSRIAILGVSYKPDIKDTQLSPMERVVHRLAEMGAQMTMYDPMFKGEKVFGLKGKGTLLEAVEGSDCVVVGTAHKEFKELDLAAVKRAMNRRPSFVDARNIIPSAQAVKEGFSYRGVGRKVETSQPGNV